MKIPQFFLFNCHFYRSSFFVLLSNKFLSFSHMILLMLLMATPFIISHCHKIKPTEPDPDTDLTGLLMGHVEDAQGPINGAVVRVQATEKYVTTNDSGQFTLTGLPVADSVKITAWAKGYYIGGGKAYWPGTKNVILELHAHHTTDNPDYQWISAFASEGDASNCQNCHAEPGNPNSCLPFDEWQRDAHSQSAKNVRFLTMYLGTDINGNQSPKTTYAYSRDYGTFPLPPNLNEPYYGPGYKLDFPATFGNCAACHTPAAVMNSPYGVDPTEAAGVGAEGVACDFCHKVWDVKFNPATGMPYDNMPGVLSFELRRPPEGHQFFSGPLDDVAPGEDTYTIVQQESRYCAPCHFGTFWGTEIYNSFGEWLDSPYSHPETGRTCQDCHMPPGQTDHFALPEKGGHKRDPKTIFSHRMPGAMDEQLIREAATMTMTARRQGESVVVNVEIVNDNTGHHIPTDSPLRHLILVVLVTDASGDTLTQTGGPVLPGWCGTGDPGLGYYAGLPGETYAKILEELWTGISPTGAYWNLTRIVRDNRIAAFESDITSCTFSNPGDGPVTVDARLIFRRAFIRLIDWKSWDTPDILMAQQKQICY